MSRIFLSHSSQDAFEVAAIRDWLAQEGWDDVFLDFDPARGIAAGERWERALHAAATRCEAVVFLVSDSWLASGWCRKEYALARALNKTLFAVLVDRGLAIADLPDELKGTWQVVDLVRGQDMRVFASRPPGTQETREIGFAEEGLRRLRRGLERAGLDPRFFAWPPRDEPARAPYRGLKPLDRPDAGIFFGRDAPIVEAVDRLRGLAEAAAPRLLVILGASGAGKSSFLRAGLLPRLSRDDTRFLTLPPIRPEAAAMTGESGLLGALAEVLPDRPRSWLRTAIEGGAAGVRPLLAGLVAEALARRVTDDAAAKPPTVVLAIDQAEEMLRGEGAEEGARLLELVRDLTADDDPAVIVVFAIRSDAYDGLEHAKPLEGLAQSALPLLPMPRNAFKEVIEGPARRLVEAGGRLEIDPLLTDRLLADIESGGGSDALPLLAFTLEQLHLAHGRNGAFRPADYDAVGGLKGAIEAAIARALARIEGDAGVPRDPAARAALLRRGLIPWLAGVDPETRTPRRNIARRSDIPADALPLIDRLIEERLLSTDTMTAVDPATGRESRVVTIEPAHEALLRQWGLLSGWLAEDFALLATLEGVQRAARDWDANERADPWLAHQDQRLAEVAALDERPDIAAKLGTVDRAYLARCRAREEAVRAEVEARRREREAEQARRLTDAEALASADRRTTQRTRIGLAAAIVLALAAASFGFYAQNQRTAAQRSLTTATSTANTLIFDLAREFRDVAGMPASLVTSIFDRALSLQDDLIASGQTSTDLLSSQASGLSAASQALITVGQTGRASTSALRSTAIWRDLLKPRPLDPSLRRSLSVALNGFGDARVLAGDQPGALGAYGESLDISRALVAVDSGPKAQDALATALSRFGDAKSQGGDRDGALAAYEEGLAIVRTLAADGTNRTARGDVAHALDRIGSIRAAIGDRTGAVGAFEEGVRLRRALAADTTNAVSQRDLAWTLGLFGEFQERAGDRTAALALYEESLVLRRGLAQERSNARAQRDLAVSLTRIALLRRLTGDLPGARGAISDGVALSRDFARDRSNAEAQRNLALSLQSEGDVRVEAGETAGALASYEESLGVFRELAKNTAEASAQRDLALILDSIGDLKIGSGDRDGALALYQEGLVIRRKRAEDAADIEAQRDLGIGLDKIGDIKLASDEPVGALSIYEESLALFRRLGAGGDPQARRDVSLSLIKVGDAKLAAQDRPGALAAYDDSLAIRRELFRQNTLSTAVRDLAGLLSKIGNVKLAGGDEAGALAALDECLVHVVTLDRGKTDGRSRQELVGVSQQVAGLKMRTGDRVGALAAYAAGLDSLRGLARDGGPPSARSALVVTLNTIGALRLEGGDKPGALAAFEDSLGDARRLATDADGTLHLTHILDNVGIVRRQLGDLDGAQSAFEESLALRRPPAQAGRDPTAQHHLAKSLGHLGEVAIDRRRLDEALRQFRAALLIRKDLFARMPSEETQDGLVGDVEQVGVIAYHSLIAREFARALEASDLAISYAPDLVWLHTNRAHALMFLGRPDEARAIYLARRGQQAQKDQTWEEAVRGDFAEFRKAGLTNPLMDRIEAALAGPRTR